MKKTLTLLAVSTFVATLSGCACCPALNCGLCCPWNRPAPACCPPPTYAAPCAPACAPAYAPVAACAPACPPAQPCVQWDPCRNAIVPRSNAMPAAPIFAQAPAMASPCSPCAQMGPQMMAQPMYYAEQDCGCGFAEASCGIPSNVGYSGMPMEMDMGMGGSGCTNCEAGAAQGEVISPVPGE